MYCVFFQVLSHFTLYLLCVVFFPSLKLNALYLLCCFFQSLKSLYIIFIVCDVFFSHLKSNHIIFPTIIFTVLCSWKLPRLDSCTVGCICLVSDWGLSEVQYARVSQQLGMRWLLGMVCNVTAYHDSAICGVWRDRLSGRCDKRVFWYAHIW